MKNKAQGAMEYLIILAGALLVAVVVIALLGNLGGTGEELAENEFSGILGIVNIGTGVGGTTDPDCDSGETNGTCSATEDYSCPDCSCGNGTLDAINATEMEICEPPSQLPTLGTCPTVGDFCNANCNGCDPGSPVTLSKGTYNIDTDLQVMIKAQTITITDKFSGVPNDVIKYADITTNAFDKRLQLAPSAVHTPYLFVLDSSGFEEDIANGAWNVTLDNAGILYFPKSTQYILCFGTDHGTCGATGTTPVNDAEIYRLKAGSWVMLNDSSLVNVLTIPAGNITLGDFGSNDFQFNYPVTLPGPPTSAIFFPNISISLSENDIFWFISGSYNTDAIFNTSFEAYIMETEIDGDIMYINNVATSQDAIEFWLVGDPLDANPIDYQFNSLMPQTCASAQGCDGGPAARISVPLFDGMIIKLWDHP